MTLVGGAIQYISRGGKLNTLIRTEAKLIGYDYTYNMILWMIWLIGYQDCDFDKKIIYQDNKYTILPENNCKNISRNCTPDLNFFYLFLTDNIEKGNLSIEY